MFGKGTKNNANSRFVMAQGRKVGNLATAKAPAASAGMSKSVPKPVVKGNPQTKKTLSVNSKRGKSVNQNLPPSLGKVNTFKT